jgi:Rrf2 family protein
MKLTRASRYAIGAIVHLARQPGKPLASHEIAEAEGIPEWFLLKVLKPAVNAGILYSYRGPGGGYQLARVPKDITLLEIVEAVEGPIQSRVEPWGETDQKLLKRLQAILDQAAAEFRRQLQKVRVADLTPRR